MNKRPIQWLDHDIKQWQEAKLEKQRQEIIKIHQREHAKRVEEWRYRLKNVAFRNVDYKEIFAEASAGDIIYCDPPYSHSQSILYGAQDFKLTELFNEIKMALNMNVEAKNCR